MRQALVEKAKTLADVKKARPDIAEWTKHYVIHPDGVYCFDDEETARKHPALESAK